MPSRKRRPRGHIEELPPGSFRAIVYGGADPLRGKERRLGNVLARAGKLEESLTVMTPVVSRVRTFGSSRIRSDVRDTIQLLDHHQGYRPARQFTAWSRKVLDVA